MFVADKNFQPPSFLCSAMDLEETVRELKSDLKNARELISCLTESVKALKTGRDEDLHRKMDAVLSQTEKQQELEKKIDSLKVEFVASREEVKFLKDELKKVAEEFRNSAEMTHIKDSVETCVGYQELFVKDFEKIHEKLQEIKGDFSVKFYNMEQKFYEGTRETGNIGNGIKNIENKVKNFERNLEGITENGQKLDVVGDKIEKLEQELKGKIGLMSKTSMERKENLEKEVNPLVSESNETKKEMNTKLTEINKKVQNITETNLKCWNPCCKSILPKYLPLREDGVSVECPKCNDYNVVGKLKEGHKWMLWMDCNDYHFQQFPLDKKNGELGNCQVCGKKGEIYDRHRQYIADPS